MKVGDKYIIEIEEVIRRNGAPQIARIKGFNALVFDKYGLEKLERYDEENDYDWEKAYLKGYENGKKNAMIESEKITTKGISDAYNKGLEDAWKLVRRIESEPDDGGLTNKQIEEVFGQYYAPHNLYNLYNEFSADEALDLYKRWEDKQNEFKVGDEVYSGAFDDKGIVSHITEDGYVAIISSGSSMMKVGLHGLRKTGRTFPQIAEVLAELRGEE